MASICQEKIFDGKSQEFDKLNPDEAQARADAPAKGDLEHIATGAFLFHPGDARALYRVESGAICHYMLWSDGRHDVIEFAFPGDIIGLGHLREHVTSAQAMVDTVVSRLDETDLPAALESDDRLSFRQAAAIEREFDYLRDLTLSEAPRAAEAKVANFLIAISNANGPEGREAEVIADDVTAGFVAEKLDMSIDRLGAALLALKKEGVVRETAEGLEIVDLPRLKKLADAA